MDKLICGGCGARLMPGARTCPFCGTVTGEGAAGAEVEAVSPAAGGVDGEAVASPVSGAGAEVAASPEPAPEPEPATGADGAGAAEAAHLGVLTPETIVFADPAEPEAPHSAGGAVPADAAAGPAPAAGQPVASVRLPGMFGVEGKGERSARRRRRRTMRIGIAVGGAAAVLLVIFAAVALMGDWELARKVEEASTSTDPVAIANLEGADASQEGVGGASLVAADDCAFWIADGSIWAISADGASEGDGASRLVGADANGLDAWGGTLFYTSVEGDGVSKLLAVHDAAGAASRGSASQPVSLTVGEAGLTIENLVVRHGLAFFTITDGKGTYSVYGLNAAAAISPEDGMVDTSVAPVKLTSVKAQGVRLAYNAATGTLTVLRWDKSGWSVEEAEVADAAGLKGASFESVMSGKGSVRDAAYVGRTAYVAQTGSGGAFTYTKLGGSYGELTELAGVARLGGADGVVAAVTEDGHVGYVNAGSGYSSDVTEAARAVLTDEQLRGCEVSVLGGSIYLVAEDGSVAQVDISGEEASAHQVSGAVGD